MQTTHVTFNGNMKAPDYLLYL